MFKVVGETYSYVIHYTTIGLHKSVILNTILHDKKVPLQPLLTRHVTALLAFAQAHTPTIQASISALIIEDQGFCSCNLLPITCPIIEI